MTNTQMMRFKAALETKREELGQEILAQSGELAIHDGGSDPIDRLQSMRQRDDAVTAIERLSRVRSDVDAALGAISEGVYGECARCGEPISLKRLETVPWAGNCVNCQEWIERREAAQAPNPAWALHFDRYREAA